MRKRLGTISALFTGALLVTGGAALAQSPAPSPGGDMAAVASKYTIDYANFSEGSDFLKNFGQGFKDAAATVGFNLNYYNNNCDAATTLNNAKLMVQDQPDLIMFAGCDAGIADAIGKNFTDAGIPCIAVNVPVTGCPLLNQVNKDVGAMAANGALPEITKRGWTGADTFAILVQCATCGTEINDSVRYAYTTLAAALPGMSVVAPDDITATTTVLGDPQTGVQVDGKANLEDSFNAVKNVLPSIPEDKHIVVFSMNDPGTQGAARALQQAGREAILVGQGGGADGIAELRTNPDWVFEPSVFNTTWSQYAMAMAWAKLIEGATLPDLTTVPQGPVDKTTVDRYYDADNKVIALPPLEERNAYLESTGVLQLFPAQADGLKPAS